MSRFVSVEGSQSNHCCFDATVIDTTVEHGNTAECFDLDDARRIAACLNACDGLPTETLEVLPGYVSAIEGFHQQRSLAVEARNQRDLLLAALEQCVASMGDDKLYVKTLAYAQRAIAAVKDGAKAHGTEITYEQQVGRIKRDWSVDPAKDGAK